MKLNIRIKDSSDKKDLQYLSIPSQDSRIELGNFEWIASNGVRICSYGFAEIVITNPDTKNEKIIIFIRGTNEEKEKQLNYFDKLTENQRKKVDEAIAEFQLYEPSNKASVELSLEIQEIKQLSEVLIPLLNSYKSNLDEIKKCFPNIDLSDIETLTVKSFTEILEITQDYVEWDSTTVSYDSIHFRDCLIVVVAGDHLIIVTSPDKFNEEV